MPSFPSLLSQDDVVHLSRAVTDRATMRRILVLCALALLPVLSACASTATAKLSCTTTAVSPSSQPGQRTARKALDSYVAKNAKSVGIPKSGYKLESHSKTRYIYASKNFKVSVTTLPVAKPTDPEIWVAFQFFVC